MVNAALMEQVRRLSAPELAELRDAIDARLAGESSEEPWGALEQRVIEADAAPDDYVTLEEWKAQRRERRTA